ncbi:MAG: hydrogenase maturation nickel metallochaperone HypA [Polyangiaceae bacterium]
MHELSLAQNLVDLVEEHRRRDPFVRVASIRLSIGALAHVEVRAFELGFEAASRGSAAEGARLVIERSPGRAHCLTCARDVEITTRGQPCAGCGGEQWLPIGGDEMRVLEMEVE